MGLQKKDTGQNFPPKIKDGKISNVDMQVFKDNEESITNCFVKGIGGMKTGNGSITGGTLWNGKKKDEKKYRLDLQGYNGIHIYTVHKYTNSFVHDGKCHLRILTDSL